MTVAVGRGSKVVGKAIAPAPIAALDAPHQLSSSVVTQVMQVLEAGAPQSLAVFCTDLHQILAGIGFAQLSHLTNAADDY